MIKLDRIQLIDLAYETVDEIKKSELYQSYLVASNDYNTADILPLIDKFNETKKSFEEISRYGRYHPGYVQAKTNYTEAKTLLFQTEAYQKYQDALLKLNLYLHDISREITAIINECLVSSNQTHSCHTKG